jgi:serine/threonine protein kinase
MRNIRCKKPNSSETNRPAGGAKSAHDMETQKLCPNCRKPLPPDVPLGLCPECLIKSGFPTESGTGVSGEAAGARFVPPPVEEIARLFPQLEILGFIGKGGMGAVYKARQPALDRFVALENAHAAVRRRPGLCRAVQP